MKRCSFFFLIIAAAVLPLPSETICIETIVSADSTSDGRAAEFAAILETGIMDTVFDNGDIVFNLSAADSEKYARGSITLAKNSGAEYLWTVSMDFNEVSTLPATVSYTVVETLKETRLLETDMKVGTLLAGEKDPFEAMKTIGRRIGFSCLDAVRSYNR